jgi:hypothetical protein
MLTKNLERGVVISAAFPGLPLAGRDRVGRVLINAQIAAPLLWAIHIGCLKNSALRLIDEGTP